MNMIGEPVNLKALSAVLALAALGAGWFAGAAATATPHPMLRRTDSGVVGASLRRRPELDTWSSDPRLGASAETTISVHASDTGAEVGKVTLYVPAGYGLDLTAAPGAKEGSALLLTGSDIGEAKLTAVGPAAFDNTPQAEECAPGAHAAEWVMSLDFLISSQVRVVPIYLDRTTGSETALGAYKLQICIPLALIPSPGGWPIGSRLRDLTFEFAHLVNPDTTASCMWRAFLSATDDSGNPDLSTTEELRSEMPLPAGLTLTGRSDRRGGRAVLSGRYTDQTLPTGGLRVALYRVGRHGARRHVATTRTSTEGTYSFVRRMTKTSTYLTEVSGIGGCPGDSTAPGGCVDETRGAIDSSVVAVRAARIHPSPKEGGAR